ncbi:response regulator [Hoeflea alexandrii]|nr:response regulator [Hoeflea alexandrii]MCY0152555.1 response regulator [Hoeflea alexandrii]
MSAPPPHRSAQTPSAEKARGGQRLELLVAEDNEVNQIVFTQILDEMGLNYRIVDNGGSAYDTWKSHRPAMILMDVSMPVMNGHQATQAIRKAEAEDADLGHTPIVGVTAHALTGDMERCLDAGMDDYLSKPISPEKLEAKIREWLPEEIAARIKHG